MFEEIVSNVLLKLMAKVGKYLANEYSDIKNAETNFDVLVTTLSEAQPLLGYFRLSLFQHMDLKFQQTVDTFTKLCYHAEDLINVVKETKSRNPNSIRSKLLKPFQPHKVKKHIELIQNTLNELQLQLEKIMDTLRFEVHKRNYRSSSFIGRENEVREIKKDLISGQSTTGVSIIGRRGLGKTTLAHFIYLDTDICVKFSNRVWIDVDGGYFNMKNAAEKLDSVVMNKHCHNLIIFDNLLYISSQEWLELWQSTLEGRNNIKILITTLNPKVSQETNTKPIFLDSLPDPKCKELIMQIAMSQNKSLTQSLMEDPTVDMLVTKCEGLPLLALIIGDRLAKLEHLEWRNLSKKEIWEWKIFQKEIFPLLKRSYEDIPPRLIDCFSYFSLFPCNHDFHIHVPHGNRNHDNIDDLFQLWESEGFLTPRENTSTFKNTADEQLHWLQERSLLQCDESGKVYKLQRLSHKIAEVVSSKTCLRFNSEGPTYLPETTRHLSLFCESLKILRDSKDEELKRLRTILSLNDRKHTDVKLELPTAIFQKGSLLRVLSLNGINLQGLSSSIKSLIHLRYLDVSRTPIRSLPDELAELSNLCFLKLSNTPFLHKLPNGFHKLTNLKCIGWGIGDIERLNPSNIGCLSKLQTLPLFRVGFNTGFLIGELQHMNYLQNSICVQNLENVKSKREAELAMLHDKELLTEIELQWNNAHNIDTAADVLTGLKPHRFLSKLKITRYTAENFPSWISNPQFMLGELHLYQCDCRRLPALGHFKALKTLVLEGMRNLSQVDGNFCGPRPNTDGAGYFPRLELLRFEDMASLQRWTGLEPNDMPCLHDLQIQSCPKMTEFPSHVFSSLQALAIISCQELDTLPNLTNLSSTSTLEIVRSDKLKEKCWVSGNEVWNTINMFQSVKIDFKVIPTTAQGSSRHDQNILYQTDQKWPSISALIITGGPLPLTSNHEQCGEGLGHAGDDNGKWQGCKREGHREQSHNNQNWSKGEPTQALSL